MTSKRFKARLAALEKVFAPLSPVRLRMSDGQIEEIAVPDEDDLAFIMRILDHPVSREAELICDAAEILDQPGRLIEVLQAVMDPPRQILNGEITPDVVQLGLCTLDQCCGLEPQTEEDLEARINALYQDS
jgi:hypothetical protein